MRIMTVDDELISRKKVGELLKPYGDVDEYLNGPTALQAFKQAITEDNFYTLITLDIDMPDMNGIEVLNEMRRFEREQRIPPDKQAKILMVTGLDDKQSCMDAMSKKCTDYVIKPIREEKLIERLTKLKII